MRGAAARRMWCAALGALLCMLGAAANDTKVTTSDGGLALANNGALVASGIVAGVVLIVVGFFFNYFGYRLLKLLIFLAGFSAVFGLVLYAEYKIRAPLDTEHARQLWYLGIAAALGALGGACVLFAYKVGVALVGALGGFALATWILAMQTNGVIHSDVGRALFIAALVVAGIVAALFIQRPAVIVASAVWGSYVLFVGIDCFARTGFQYTALAFLSTPGAVYETTPKVYAMIACMALSALLGIFAQFRLTRKPKASFIPL
ncbi:hypothetical protein IW139_001804 [Coemansia sp. RSA 353]|nr:hypothetical protein J3F82_006010 [Coemansia sp. RSA 637]KAJ2141101.1 hypothetical protein IW142_005041 [Coemansia sp. RSA 564]KAJ2172964.1 hypothetical protein GGF45_004521 [Coemansia sp. RSA 551]KAJ2206014.1 hypothetical protein IW145_002417 [Coemansia sp. RSA 521]KAJ2244872.1 hypothetical protein GGH98_004708 [Coemansia sp. RSA 454]KAJ2274247.1 hypothetical protein J3F81_002312 [Coemansia sp. RSA 371]KAJ2281684.1 hypothetical protein GGH14_001908 [Coemansia sp. RSA 370]KAJ2299300.1 hyp